RAFVGDRKRKPIIRLVGRGLRKDVGLGRRGRIRFHNPMYRSSLAGEGFVKPGWRLARGVAVEVVLEFSARGLKRRGSFWRRGIRFRGSVILAARGDNHHRRGECDYDCVRAFHGLPQRYFVCLVPFNSLYISSTFG